MQKQIQDLTKASEVLRQEKEDLKNQTNTMNTTLYSVINQLNALVDKTNTQEEKLSFMIDSRSCEIKTCDGGDWTLCSCDNGKLAINCGCDAYGAPNKIRAVGIVDKTGCRCGGYEGLKLVTVMCC